MTTSPECPGAELHKYKLEELHYSAVVDAWKRERAAELEARAEESKLIEQRLDDQVATENALRAAVHGAYLDVAKASLERSLQRATFVTGAAGTMATIYSGLLALVYSVSKEGAAPMPASGIGPAAFLGLSLVLSTVYVAFINRSFRDGRHLRSGLGSPLLQERRLATFLDWSIGGSYRRAWALRTSVLSLGVGVALTPLPFLELSELEQWRLIGFGAGILVVNVLVEWVRWWRSERPKPAKDSARPQGAKAASPALWYRRLPGVLRIRERIRRRREGRGEEGGAGPEQLSGQELPPAKPSMPAGPADPAQ